MIRRLFVSTSYLRGRAYSLPTKCCARSATRNRLLGEGCVFEKVGERRRRKALDVPNSDIAQYVIVTGRRLPADDAAQAIPELPLHCQPWKLGENRTRLLV